LLALIGAWNPAAAQTLRVALSNIPPNKSNPHTAVIDFLGTWSAVLDPLTVVASDGTLKPWLATDWRQETANTWVFTLRDDVTFSNGRTFEAGAIVETIAYLTSQAGRTDLLARELSHLVSAEAIDPRTVRVTANGPRPFMPYELSLMMIPEPYTWRERDPDAIASTPIGTGPFQVDAWAADRIELDAVQNSWRRPRARRLELFQARDANARFTGFKSDRFDIASQIDPDNVAEVEAMGGRIHRNTVPAAFAIIFNTVKDFRFRDPRVRRALNYAVNKQVIIDVLFKGLTVIASQPAPRSALGYNPDIEPYPYDPEKARRLLAEAGYGDGFSFVMEVSNESSLTLNIHQQVAADLARVGVKMTILTVPRPKFLRNLQDGGWEGSAFPSGYFTPNYDALRSMLTQSCLWPKPWHCDQEIMPLIEEAFAEADMERRTRLTRQIMAYGHEQAQGLFLYEAANLTALGPKVGDYRTEGSFVLYEAVHKTK
jgi:peptide/nickel transport system substrate-binding protein